nr:MAG: hypothetical protein [Enquatrovirus sp.]
MKFLLTNGSEVKFFEKASIELVPEAVLKILSNKSYKLYALIDITDTFDLDEEEPKAEEPKETEFTK